jgi:DNA-binding FrmR family transcriptional regulator
MCDVPWIDKQSDRDTEVAATLHRPRRGARKTRDVFAMIQQRRSCKGVITQLTAASRAMDRAAS